MWERTVFPILWRRNSGRCTCLHCSSQSTSEDLCQKPPHRSLIPHLSQPHLVLGSHRVSSVEELIQIQINHFHRKLVLPWWLSCSSSLYSCTNSYITERERVLVGRKGRSCDLWAARVQCAPEELYVSSWCWWKYSKGSSLIVILCLTSSEISALNLYDFSKVM